MATNGLETRRSVSGTGDMAGGRRARWALLATSLGFGVVQLDVSVVNVAIKPIGADLGGGVSGLQWVVGAYTLAFAALILSAGAFGDRIGARRVFIPRDRSRAVGLWAAGASVALSAGPLIGGVLTSALSWRWIFFINAPIGLAGILLTVRFATETPKAADRVWTCPASWPRSPPWSRWPGP